MRGELRLAKEALQRAGRSVRRRFFQQPVPVTAPHQGSAQTAQFMNPAERWNGFAKVSVIAGAISVNAKRAAGDQHSSLATLVDRVENAAQNLQEQLHAENQGQSGYIIDVEEGRKIADNELTELWAAIQALDACETLPKEVCELICHFNDLSAYLLKEASGKAMCAAPRISDAYMLSTDIRDLGFLHELVRDETVQGIALGIETNLIDAEDATRKKDGALASTCLLAVKDLFDQLKQHLQTNYPESAIQGHCTAIDKRLEFFADSES